MLTNNHRKPIIDSVMRRCRRRREPKVDLPGAYY